MGSGEVDVQAEERATYTGGVCAISLIAHVAFTNDFAVDIAGADPGQQSLAESGRGKQMRQPGAKKPPPNG